jgi:hypothetical protein
MAMIKIRWKINEKYTKANCRYKIPHTYIYHLNSFLFYLNMIYLILKLKT